MRIILVSSLAGLLASCTTTDETGTAPVLTPDAAVSGPERGGTAPTPQFPGQTPGPRRDASAPDGRLHAEPPRLDAGPPDALASADAGGTPDGGPGRPRCDPLLEEQPIIPAVHIPACRPAKWGAWPPSSGAHYDEWAAYKTYDKPVPWGFLVHNLEHGAVIFTYNCKEGCPVELAALQALIDDLPGDAACDGTRVKRRVILMPDPQLDVRFAASAWGWTLRSGCFDGPAFRRFYQQRLGGKAAPEPNHCGQGVDRSEKGWCPARGEGD